ncbi:hypothetical protein BRC82_04280 [Halobacteriales archaeon QS_1_67_19]|nr:MAG: hypothetical protein BRC82_04280 [Halobacteriales archaeon QS_1_67_19]
MTAHNANPSREEVFDAVQNLRRRYVLYYLQRFDDPVKLGDLAEQVAAWENDTTPDAVTSNQRKSVYSALHQTHLPRLEAAGVLEYDTERSLIRATRETAGLEIQLASDPQTSLPWHKLYLSLAAVSLLVLLSIWQNLFPFSLSGVEYALLVVTAFGATATGHTYDRRQWRRRTENAAPDLSSN